MQFKRQPRKLRHVNIIPLINVIFLLLIFFIVTGTYQEEDPQEIAVPYAKSGKDIGDQPYKIVLTDDGLVMLNDISVPPNKLYKELSSLLEKEGDGEISLIIMADAKLNAENLLNVVADVQRAGIGQISLITKGL